MKYTINTTSERDIEYSHPESATNWEDVNTVIDFQLGDMLDEYEEEGKAETQVDISIALLSKIINNQNEEIRLLRLLLDKKK